MKASIHFTNTIKSYLEQRALTDELFANTFAKPQKNMDDCVTYILNTVQQSGCNGFADDEIFGMAVHYYDEDNIEVGKPMNCNVVVNHIVELTDEEKEQARKDAIQKLQNEAYLKLSKPSSKPKAKQIQSEVSNQPNLFDL